MLRMITYWLPKVFDNILFREKMFFIFFLVTFLPLLFFVYYSHHTIRKELTDQTYSKMGLTIAQINTNLENKLDTYEKISSTLYMDKTLRAYLNRNYTSDDNFFVDAYRYFDNTFNNILTTNPDIHSLSIYTTNVTLPLDSVFIKHLDTEFQQSQVYRALQDTYGNIRFLTKPAEPSAPPMFTLTRLLNSDSLNYPYGILTMSILESVIYSLIEKESKDKSIFIIDEQGIILSSKDKNMIKKNLNKFISTGYNDGQEGKFDDTYNREQVLVTYNTTKFGWKTVSIIPYSTFMTNAQTVTRHILTIALASTCFSALLIYVAARLFSKRVEYLLRVTKRVETGDFSVRIAPLGHDEIGQLGFAFNHMVKRLNSLITEVYKKEIDKKEAEMNLLQSQINPHFLYNTLASISSLAIQNHDQRMNKIVSDLAKFYRISLNKGKNVLSIHEEIQLTRYYVSILQIRFEGMLRVHYDIDESVLPCPIVKLTLQPFVENCVNHAIWNDKLGINIIIKAYRDGEYIILKVIDDGMGCRQTAKSSIPEEDIKTSGYGIQNVDQRIKLFFGNTCGVTFYSKLGIGTTVQISILG